MYAFALKSLGFVVLMAASPSHALRTGGTLESPGAPDLMTALQESDVAEIYVISRGVEFPITSRPETVREVGCKYLIHRQSPQWRDLERALAQADVRMAPGAVRGEMRIGLVFSDRRGTIREIYSNDQPWPDGRITGFTQRQEVEISPAFVTALLGFVERNRDMALPSPHCPRESGR